MQAIQSTTKNKMKDIFNNYLEAKKIIDIASDADNKLNNFVRSNTTIEQIIKLQEFVKWCEDSGVTIASIN